MIGQVFTSDKPFRFDCGTVVNDLSVAYYCSPEVYRKNDDTRKVIWICQPFSSDAEAYEGWWSEFVGPGKVVDTEKYFVITAMPCLGDLQGVTVRDIVRSLDLLREELGIGHIDLIIGTSADGLQAKEWEDSCPELFTKAAYLPSGAGISMAAGILKPAVASIEGRFLSCFRIA